MSDEPQNLTTSELAKRLRLKPQTVRLWRMRGYGPPYVRVSSRCIIYRAEDVDAWMADRTFMNTAEEATGEISPGAGL